jgi:malate synthase
MANWLLHGVVSEADIDAAFARMAKKVDAQNAGDPLYLVRITSSSFPRTRETSISSTASQSGSPRLRG